MSPSHEIIIAGSGCVTPFGWGKGAFLHGMIKGGDAAEIPLAPAPPNPAPAWYKHPRLRRTSPIAKYVVHAGLEALGAADDPDKAAQLAPERLGIVLCIQNGCVNFTQRFYGEVLDTPGFASPILFPETVFNSPASHLAAILGRTTVNYTILGDAATFIQGLEVAVNWLRDGTVDGALVIAAEEQDKLTENAHQLFHPGARVSAGAGAVYLKAVDKAPPASLLLAGLTKIRTFADGAGSDAATQAVEEELREMIAGTEFAEIATWKDAERSDLEWWFNQPLWRGRELLGDGLSAAGAWKFVFSCAISNGLPVLPVCHAVPVIGAAEQAGGALIMRPRRLSSPAFQ